MERLAVLRRRLECSDRHRPARAGRTRLVSNVPRVPDPDVAVVKASSTTVPVSSRTSIDTVASNTFAVPRSRIGLETLSPSSGDSIRICGAVRLERLSSHRLAALDDDALDVRELGQRVHDLRRRESGQRRILLAGRPSPCPARPRRAQAPRLASTCRSRRPAPPRSGRRSRDRRVAEASSAGLRFDGASDGCDLALANEVDRDLLLARPSVTSRHPCTRLRRARGVRSRAVSCANRASELFGNQVAASRASAASVLPTAGANLNPWPEQAEPTTMRPWRSRTNSSSAVLV